MPIISAKPISGGSTLFMKARSFSPSASAEVSPGAADNGALPAAPAVAATGATFVAFGIAADSSTITFKVQDVDKEHLIKAITPLVDEIIDVRE